MSASGYKEKVPTNVHDENMSKLTALMQELQLFEENIGRLENQIASA